MNRIDFDISSLYIFPFSISNQTDKTFQREKERNFHFSCFKTEHAFDFGNGIEWGEKNHVHDRVRDNFYDVMKNGIRFHDTKTEEKLMEKSGSDICNRFGQYHLPISTVHVFITRAQNSFIK